MTFTYTITQAMLNVTVTGADTRLDGTGANGSDALQKDMEWAVENGIMNGYPDGSLQPGGAASRAHVAAMVQRFCTTLV